MNTIQPTPERQSLLEERIGYRFRNPDLFQEALTHKSFSNEHPGDPPYNERLEFLGDAVLDLVVSNHIFLAFPDFDEGELTRIRAEVVSERSLSRIGRQMGLGDCLFLGKGEERSGGRDKDSLLADAIEALLGAIFCDGGLDAVREVAERLLYHAIRRSAVHKAGLDHKTRLQEVTQGRFGRPPLYVLTGIEGPDHQRVYKVEVRVSESVIGRGEGRTKKAAEQEAAREALGLMN